MQRLNAWLLWFFVFWTFFCVAPFSPGFQLAGQVWYVTLISHVALVLALLSAWESSRVEVRQEDDADVQEVKDEVQDLKDDVG